MCAQQRPWGPRASPCTSEPLPFQKESRPVQGLCKGAQTSGLDLGSSLKVSPTSEVGLTTPCILPSIPHPKSAVLHGTWSLVLFCSSPVLRPKAPPEEHQQV